MNAAICSRNTASTGQYSPAAQPSVTLRFLIQSTLAQNGLVLSTSLNAKQGGGPAARTVKPAESVVARNDALPAYVAFSM